MANSVTLTCKILSMCVRVHSSCLIVLCFSCLNSCSLRFCVCLRIAFLCFALIVCVGREVNICEVNLIRQTPHKEERTSCQLQLVEEQSCLLLFQSSFEFFMQVSVSITSNCAYLQCLIHHISSYEEQEADVDFINRRQLHSLLKLVKSDQLQVLLASFFMQPSTL